MKLEKLLTVATEGEMICIVNNELILFSGEFHKNSKALNTLYEKEVLNFYSAPFRTTVIKIK